jgi:hypothetical protein
MRLKGLTIAQIKGLEYATFKTYHTPKLIYC